MVLTLHFFQGVSQDVQENIIGSNDGAIHVEFDHGLSLAYGGDLAGIIGI